MKIPKEIEGKVFCKDCKYYRYSNSVYYGQECKKELVVQYNPISWETRYGDPLVINKNNDCKMFEPKEAKE